MEIISFNKSLNRYWRRRGYNRVSVNRKKVVRFGAGKTRSWRRLRLAPKIKLASPLKLWYKFKNAYMNMMLRLAKSANTFGEKRIPQVREVTNNKAYKSNEFENRLVYEIYKSMVASYELGYTPNKAMNT